MKKKLVVSLRSRPILLITRMITDRIQWTPLSAITIINGIYHKILESDWLSTTLILALIAEFVIGRLYVSPSAL